MKHLIIFFLFLFAFIGVQAQDMPKEPRVFENQGIYYRDRAQTQLYTGDLREHYDNGTLKREIQIKDGVPEGAYVIYFENRKPKEVRSYKQGNLHGLWRKYDISGQLISEAEYKDSKKHGTWRIWDELGVQRYEMNYYEGNKTGLWRMWDEKGNLLDEKKY